MVVTVTRQFIPYLCDAAGVFGGMPVLDVACGPGYVSDAIRSWSEFHGASISPKKMVEIATKMFPEFGSRKATHKNCQSSMRASIGC
jgi:cyclopropane fatty-acyl-phospholipid synthase-like methyltransferase